MKFFATLAICWAALGSAAWAQPATFTFHGDVEFENIETAHFFGSDSLQGAFSGSFKIDLSAPAIYELGIASSYEFSTLKFNIGPRSFGYLGDADLGHLLIVGDNDQNDAITFYTSTEHEIENNTVQVSKLFFASGIGDLLDGTGLSVVPKFSGLDLGETSHGLLYTSLGDNYSYMSNLSLERSETVFPDRIATVPEPGTWLLMILGFSIVAWSIRCRRCSTRISVG